MAAITIKFAETASRTTFTTTPSTILTMSSSNFVAGEKYLLLAKSELDGPSASALHEIRTLHGGTVFAESVFNLEPPNSGTAKGANYVWFTVWQAVTSEDITIEAVMSTGTGGAQFTTLTAIRLTNEGLTENTDWRFAEVATDQDLSTTALTDGASLTFTPASGDDYLVMTYAQHTVSSLTTEYGSQLYSSGTYNETSPYRQREGEDTANIHMAWLGRVFTGLGATSQTFREESFNAVGSASGQRIHSAIFAINLKKFNKYTAYWSATDIGPTLTTSAWSHPWVNGQTLTPAASGMAFVLVSASFQHATSTGNEVNTRLQRDDDAGGYNDTPSGQTSADKQEQEAADITDREPFTEQYAWSATASVVSTFHWEGDLTNSASNEYVDDVLLVAFSDELASAATAYTFDAAPASFALTGIAADLLAGRALDGQPGAFALTGIAATIEAQRLLAGDPGAYTLAGQDATTLADRALEGVPGAYALTGLDAALPSPIRFAADPGSYALTGIVAGLLADRLLAGDPGAYALAGQDATVLATRLLALDTGVYSLTGLDANLVGPFLLSADPGSYSLSGIATGLFADRLLSADPASFALTGIAATILADRLLGLETGAYLFSGQDANLLAARALAADPGAYALTGIDATLLYTPVGAFELNAETGAFVLTGLVADLLADRLLSADPGAYALTGIDATVLADRLLTADPITVTLTGSDAELAAHRLFTADPGAFVVTGIDAGLIYTPVGNFELIAETGLFVLTGLDASLTADRLFALDPGAYIVTGVPATVAAGRLFSADAGAFTLTGLDLTTLVTRLLIGAPGSYVVTGQDAALVAARLFGIDPGAYTVSGQDATLLWAPPGVPTVRPPYKVTILTSPFTLLITS